MIEWGTMSRAERDAAYNNTGAVKNSATLNAARAAESAAFRAAHPEHLDLRYGPKERNTWDLFPAADPNAPCIVFIHGGYWQRNSKDQFANLVAGPYAHGWAGALPGYTLAPDATLTEIAAEINASLDWLAEHGPAHGINGKVVLSGWSAGGHLTAMGLDHPLVTAGLAILDALLTLGIAEGQNPPHGFEKRSASGEVNEYGDFLASLKAWKVVRRSAAPPILT